MKEANKSTWITLLKVMGKYHSKLDMIPDLLNKLQTGQIDNLTPSQATAIENIYEKSWHIKKINADLKAIKEKKETEVFTKAMNEKFKATTPIEVNTSAYEEFLIEERPTIGFKTQTKNRVSSPIQTDYAPNRYSERVNMKTASPKYWDDKKWDNFWND